MTVVTQFTTWTTTTYSCDPRKAVVCAYEQIINKNFNTWQYDFNQARLVGKTWCCGTGGNTFTAPIA